MKSRIDDSPAFEMIFSGFFGVRFINYYAQSADEGSAGSGNPKKPQEAYLDIDLDLQRVTDKIFLVFHENKVFVTSGGLSFVDIIYIGDFIPHAGAGHGEPLTEEMFYIDFDIEYIQPAHLAR